MTDQMDRRLEELVNKLAASAPEAPPFPRVATSSPAPARRMPGWALSVAGAVAMLVVIGLPFLLFTGGTPREPAQPSVTTLPDTPPTTAPGTTPTTTPTTTATTIPGTQVPTCPPAGLLVRALPEDGTAGHVVTPLQFTNVSGGPCTLDDPTAVIGIGAAGEEVPAVLGSAAPKEDSGPLLQAGDSRTMLIEVGTGCEGGRLIGPEAAELRISVGSGDTTVPFSGDLGCDFSYRGFGDWLGIEPPSDAERSLVDALIAWAPAPTGAPLPPFADTVTLTLGPDITRSETPSSLSDTQSWVFGAAYDGFRARTAPFSALDLLAGGHTVSVTSGPHDHCAAPAMPINQGFTGLRQLSIQPTEASSCLEWWTVDLFLTGAGEIAGVTLDVWEP